MERKSNKKLIVSSIVSVSLCAALLVSTSFAWFTDKVVNNDNTITSGSLKIEATAYDWGLDNALENPRNLEEDNTKFMSETNWEPGQSSKKAIIVKNTGTLATDVNIDFSNFEGKLAEVIDVKTLVVNYNYGDSYGTGKTYYGAIIGGEGAPIEDLEGVLVEQAKDGFNNGWGVFTNNTGYIQLLPNQEVAIYMTYGMDAEAGNEYQAESFSMDLSINAKQSTYEKDGFGSDQYDVDAPFQTEASTEADLIEAAAFGGNIVLNNDITLSDNLTFVSGSKLYLPADVTLTVPAGKTITLTSMPKGEGKVDIQYGATYYLGSTLYVSTTPDQGRVTMNDETAKFTYEGSKVVLGGNLDWNTKHSFTNGLSVEFDGFTGTAADYVTPGYSVIGFDSRKIKNDPSTWKPIAEKALTVDGEVWVGSSAEAKINVTGKNSCLDITSKFNAVDGIHSVYLKGDTNIVLNDSTIFDKITSNTNGATLTMGADVYTWSNTSKSWVK